MKLTSPILDPHRANIYFHIASGTLALAAGFVALVSTKGSQPHRRAGRWFLVSMCGIWVTAAIGLALFDFRAFLATVTLLTMSTSFSGYRALILRGARPRRVDTFVAGALLGWNTFDVLRLVLPAGWLRRVWIHEHVAKMMASYLAVIATFAATVLPAYQPWAAGVPAIAGTLSTLFILSGLSKSMRTKPRQPDGTNAKSPN
jgi:uncharacterized membrane protein